MTDYRIDPFPRIEELDALWRRAWGGPVAAGYGAVLERSLAHVGAWEEGRLAGFVNVAWDGGVHAFILDTCVDPDVRRRGIGTQMMRLAIAVARERGAEWLHVDYEPHLDAFYIGCGFRPTLAGLIRLRPEQG